METFLKSVISESFQKIRQLYAKRGKLKNRTPLLSGNSVFMWRSVADSNRCNWFCRPAPSHSANRPIFYFNFVKSAADYSASRRELALSELGSNRCNWFCRPAPSHSANRPSDAIKRKISKKFYFCFSSQRTRS